VERAEARRGSVRNGPSTEWIGEVEADKGGYGGKQGDTKKKEDSILGFSRSRRKVSCLGPWAEGGGPGGQKVDPEGKKASLATRLQNERCSNRQERNRAVEQERRVRKTYMALRVRGAR